MSSLKKICKFLNARKKYWLFPVLLVLVLFGSLIILSPDSKMTAFVYTIF